jgi:hypothetical protein
MELIDDLLIGSLQARDRSARLPELGPGGPAERDDDVAADLAKRVDVAAISIGCRSTDTAL